MLGKPNIYDSDVDDFDGNCVAVISYSNSLRELEAVNMQILFENVENKSTSECGKLACASCLNFLIPTPRPNLLFLCKTIQLFSTLCRAARYLSDSQRLLCAKFSMSRRNGTFSTTHRRTLLFSSKIRLVSLSKISKYFGFNSNLCCFLFSSRSS